MKKWNLSIRISIVAFLCLCLAFLTKKWTDSRMNHYLGHLESNSPPIAQVKNKKNEVFRKHTGHLLWLELNGGETIYLGNSVQTEKNSSSRIIFDEGEEILIGPESMVRFEKQDDKISLQLIEGKIEISGADLNTEKNMGLKAKKNKRLFITTPKGQLEVKNNRLKIQAGKENTDNFKIEVVTGSAELISENTSEVLQQNNKTSEIEVLDMEEVEKNKLSERVPAAEFTPVSLPPTAPKVKSIKVKEVE